MSTELKKWLTATRPWSIPASAAPVIVIASWLYGHHAEARWSLAPLVLLSAVLFQLAGNLISDYFDFSFGVDTVETAGSRTLPDKIFRPRTILLYGLIILAIGSLSGLYLAWLSGPFLFYLGLAGCVATFFYYALKFRGAGVFLIFVIFGPGIALGTEYTLTCQLSWECLLLSLPIGLLTTAILHANDIRDQTHDQAAGVHTFALWLGPRNASHFYRFLIITPYLLIGGYGFSGILPLTSLIILITLPMARAAVHTVTDTRQLDSLDRITARLQTVFSIFITVSLLPQIGH
ncbi:MAG: prenyltransferase [Planctomycetia bacterium]|nr:prenyltransferase [Planctomycetia bacterium]